jgi:hypothetical protein
MALEAPDRSGHEVVPGVGRSRGHDLAQVGSQLQTDPGGLRREDGDFLSSNVILFWNLFQAPDITPQQMEERRIYNTNHYAQGNEGYEFTSVLADEERWALIEYLKTL